MVIHKLTGGKSGVFFVVVFLMMFCACRDISPSIHPDLLIACPMSDYACMSVYTSPLRYCCCSSGGGAL